MNGLIQKYVGLLNLKIKKQNQKIINCKCELCHEGNSYRWKTRGFILLKDEDTASYVCHNCGASLSFTDFLTEINPTLGQAYKNDRRQKKIERFKKREDELSVFEEDKKTPELPQDLSEYFKDEPASIDIEKYGLKLYHLEKNRFEVFGQMVRFTELNDIAVEYLKGRGVKESDLSRFVYCEEHNAIVVPFFFKDGEPYIYAYQLRMIDEKVFHNEIFTNETKLYNIYNILEDDSITKDTEVWLFESIFDMLSVDVDHGIALLGRTINKDLLAKLKTKCKVVFCMDNDEEGEKASLKMAKQGFHVVVYDDNFPRKDLNKVIEDGLASRSTLTKYVRSRVLKGLKAELEIRV